MKKTPLKRSKIKNHLTKDGKLKPGYTKSGKPKHSTQKKRIDLAMGYVVRSQGVCFAEGHLGWRCSQRFENCHIRRRGHTELFAHPQNLVCMCNVHHRYFTAREEEWKAFVESKLPGRYELLDSIILAHALSGQKVDWDVWEEYWKELAKETKERQ